MSSKLNWLVLVVATLFLGGCVARAVLRSISKTNLNQEASVEGGFMAADDYQPPAKQPNSASYRRNG